MKAILMSIQPKWCELIANGAKTIEVRKTAPKEVPFKVYIYQTKKRWIYKLLPWLEKRQAKVVGEFICDKVDKYDYHRGIMTFGGELGLPIGTIDTYFIFEDDYKAMCLSYDEVKTYGKGEPLCGLHISDLKIYDKPKKLSEFRKPCVDPYEYCQGCKYGTIIIPDDEMEYALYHGGHCDRFETVCHNYVTRPPQSWQYVEEL